MNTLLIPEKGSSSIMINGANMDFKTVANASVNIDWMWIAPEDCEIRYKQNGKNAVQSANKGDIIIKFYEKNDIEGYTTIIVVKNKDWKKNIALVEAKHNYDAERFIAAHQELCTNCKTPCDECGPF